MAIIITDEKRKSDGRRTSDRVTTENKISIIVSMIFLVLISFLSGLLFATNFINGEVLNSYVK